jgi:hypothetical protein
MMSLIDKASPEEWDALRRNAQVKEKAMQPIKIYLIGDIDSPKNNSWLAMTNDIKQVEILLDTLEDACTYKSIRVKERV